jgi:hypothetical protein
LEYKLNQLCKDNAQLKEILPSIRETMEQLGRKEEEVGPPYTYAYISEEGFKAVD